MMISILCFGSHSLSDHILCWFTVHQQLVCCSSPVPWYSATDRTLKSSVHPMLCSHLALDKESWKLTCESKPHDDESDQIRGEGGDSESKKMEDDMWAVSSSSSSRSYRSATTTAKYQSGSYLVDSGDFEEEYDEDDDDDDVAVDYRCPFCSDDYDLVELCHHIDEEHQPKATHGVCPVCSRRVKMHMVDHITTHHKHVLKSDQKQTSSYSEDPPYSLDKYLHDDLPPSMNHHHHHRTSKAVVADQFLSFIHSSPLPNQTKHVQQHDSGVQDKKRLINKDTWMGNDMESSTPSSSATEQLEKANKCEFVQGLLSSAMFDDGWMDVRCDFL